MKHKVLVETCVIVSASVYSARQDIKPLKHRFFDRSMSLFGFLSAHRNKRIGLVTKTIELEASRNLNKAVIEELGEQTDRLVRSILLDACWDRMTDLLWILKPIEPVDQKKVDEKFVAIACMYRHLTDRASLVTRSTVRAAIENKIRQTFTPFRKLASDIYARQLLRDRSQLTRLRNPSKRPDPTDHFILAEAAHLGEKYAAQEPIKMFLASTDLAFSPILANDSSILSDDVTREIQNRFAVYCDWPERIASELRKIYH